MFQVYNSIIHHLYIKLCVHHPISSLLPSPCIPLYPLLPPLLAPHPVLSGNHRTIVFVYEGGCFLVVVNPFTFFTKPLDPLPSDSSQSVLCIYESVCIFLNLLRFHISEII